ncbi:methyltransferase-like protein 16 [Pyrus ussuriensis x Pyrus communis]|uniref:Methyltransferase-like protein 16 n=1 Tax=Pyrus ussuriensis x Pyrus communis TaxID=2448454 RepID=A0A5N5FHM6_9ROSA|nr:methyltransferase-like protein 16 [Pyrus ussuriensis x Pyrus communis]
MSMNKIKKRKRKDERPATHPRNKYSENPPEFAHLASLYPSFQRIPDGQLCPTVPNRSNYIHWIEDLLSSDIIVKTTSNGDKARGFDIGTGANCIYPLLGASLLGWSFVGSDVSDVAPEWAEKKVRDNSHISELIEIRKVEGGKETLPLEGSHNGMLVSTESKIELTQNVGREVAPSPSSSSTFHGPPILLGVVKDGEEFDFCMCSPPFFETMEEAGLNPKTACGGTATEMVFPGGEKAFITRIIEDSVSLKHTFRWYTSMVGRKLNVKILTSKLWEVGVTMVMTTEFVQSQKSQMGAGLVLFASCQEITMTKDHSDAILKGESQDCDRVISCEDKQDASTSSSCLNLPSIHLGFRVSVRCWTLLVKGSLQQRDSQLSGEFSPIYIYPHLI